MTAGSREADGRPAQPAVLVVICLALTLLPAPVTGQLRPYEPLDWSLFEAERSYSVSVGGAVLADQKASLAGTEGTLIDVGRFQVAVRSGRVALVGSGTIHRILLENQSFADPVVGTNRHPVGRRSDSGDYSIATTFILLPAGERVSGLPSLALRFGTRLPTTDNRVGIERDQTDFFALVAGRRELRRVHLFAETGLGIHGTRDLELEQSDVIVFIAGATLTHSTLEPTLLLTGHADGIMDGAIRGNEELAEVRLRVRSTGWREVQVEVIRGLGWFSPTWGLGVMLSLRG